MSDQGTLVTGIEYKIRTLTGLLERLNKENTQLQIQQSEMNAMIEKQKSRIQQLEEKNVQLQLHLSMGKVGEAESVKQKINELVREVDRCIALLNK